MLKNTHAIPQKSPGNLRLQSSLCLAFTLPTDYQAITCISSNSRGGWSRHIQALGASADVPFIVLETFNFYRCAHAAKVSCERFRVFG